MVDNKSIENFVSQEIVDKLSLKIKKLTRPYMVASSKGGRGSSHSCLVKFTLEKSIVTRYGVTWHHLRCVTYCWLDPGSLTRNPTLQ